MSSDANKPQYEFPASFQDADVQWVDKLTLQCKGVQLKLTQGFDIAESNDEVITLFKDPRFVGLYADLLDGFRVDNMVEVGIWDGGSAIFFWNLLKPRKLCCIELKKKADKLSGYIERESLGDSFRVHFGVDQSDRERLPAIIREDYGTEPLDLIIDDASHLYGPSRATFESLFPYLREGGLYFLEDWKTNLLFPNHGGGEEPDDPPFHQLAFELLEMAMRNPGLITSVRSYHNFVIVERGPDPLPAEGFSVDNYLE